MKIAGRPHTRSGEGRWRDRQSAVSQQIAALERILGERLFERLKGASGVSLTEAGKVLVRHTRDLGALLASAQADMEAFSAGALGSLRVGAFQTPGARILPEILREFFVVSPGTEVRFGESVTDHGLLDELEEGELDLAFAALPVRDGPFVVTPLVEDPFLLVCACARTTTRRFSARRASASASSRRAMNSLDIETEVETA